jgi:hypothetical protein
MYSPEPIFYQVPKINSTFYMSEPELVKKHSITSSDY